MKYTEGFKRRVLEVFRYRKDLKTILRAIEDHDNDQVRMCLEDAIEDKSLFYSSHTRRDGSPKVHHLKKKTYKERKDLYDEFMIKYDRELTSRRYRSGDKLLYDRTRIQRN